MDREQELIDICFQLTYTVNNNRKFFEDKNQEQLMDWTRNQLRSCGFNVTDPVGASWGVLKD